MKIPSIDENIKFLMGGGQSKSSVDRTRMSDGSPLFTRESILAAKNDLDIQLRSMFNHFKIGKTYFTDKAVEYYQRIEGHSKDKSKSDTQNLVRTLEKGNITFNRFEETVRTLGFEIVDQSVTIRDDVGELHTFSTSKTLESLKQQAK